MEHNNKTGLNKYYFAYGSNMDLSRMKERKVSFQVIGLAVLNEYELRFNKIKDSCSGYANIVPAASKSVEGILYELESFEQLDICEGVEKKHYDRIEVTVELDKLPVLANVYIACAKRVKEGLKPRLSYLNHLRAGNAYLSHEYMKFLNSFDTIEDDKVCD